VGGGEGGEVGGVGLGEGVDCFDHGAFVFLALLNNLKMPGRIAKQFN
jgi:hypothetical protein